jgi:1-aminocyclopropane-1-carboxylate deaminase
MAVKLLQTLDWSLARNAGVDLSVLRLDLISETAPGNKYFKLKQNLEAALAEDASCVASFGGNWSNHIHALAARAHERGLQSVGFIRGEPTETAMLDDARRWGMQIHFVGFGDYRQRYNSAYQQCLHDKYGPFYLIPEGGSNVLGAKGCAEIPGLIDMPFDRVICPGATGGTFAGIVSAISAEQRAFGIAVLPDRGHMDADIKALLGKLGSSVSPDNWIIDRRFDFGGYARSTEELLLFMASFTDETDVPLDFVYTGKLFYGIAGMLKAGEIAAGSRVVAVHTGGLQGQRGAPQ